MGSTRASRLKQSVLGLAALGLLASSCGTNPLASGSPGTGTTLYGQQAESLAVSGVFFAPQNHINIANNFTLGPPSAATETPGSGAYLDTGAGWLYSEAPTNSGQDATGVYSFLACDLPANLLSNVSHYFNNVWMRGGPGGDQFSDNPDDYYVRLEGHFFGNASNDCGTASEIPNGSTQYMELPIFFHGNDGPGVDVSNYHGFSFWTRGTGNFSVCLLAGSQGGSPPAPGPYIQLNLYQYLFSSYLTGGSQWHQVVVYFSDMNQTYGLATSQQAVLQQLYGLQFMQMGSPGPPVQADFWLDVDYIRFF